jgi:LEA14-like dessication related protein
MLPRPFRCLLGSVLLLVLGACSLLHPHLIRPDITVVSVELRKGNFLQQSFAVRLHIHNPNDRALPVQGLHAELAVDGDKIAEGDTDRDFLVPALGDTDFDMTINANLALAMIKLADRLNRHADSVDYELTGAARVQLPFHNNLPFHQMGSFSLRGN